MSYISLTELAAYQARTSEEFSLTFHKHSKRVAFNIPRKILKALGIIKGDKVDILFDIANGEGTIKRSPRGYTVDINKSGRGLVTVTWRKGLPKPKDRRYVFEYFVDGNTLEILFTFSPEIFTTWMKED